jgi:hypothetical protein
VVLLIVRQYIAGFWKRKIKVPFKGAEEWNDAITLNLEVRLQMAYLAVGWGVIGGLEIFGG